MFYTRLVVLESGLRSVFAGLGLGLGLGLGGSASKSFYKSDEFEQAFGKNNGIPATVWTRWNSTLRQLQAVVCLLYTSPSPRDRQKSRMPSSA